MALKRATPRAKKIQSPVPSPRVPHFDQDRGSGYRRDHFSGGTPAEMPREPGRYSAGSVSPTLCEHSRSATILPQLLENSGSDGA
jgi:hypothetical protein